jgi:hypothetical protein
MLPAAAGMPTAESVASPGRIPADVEREDRVLAGLTLRQLAILVVVGLVLYAAYAATRTVVPPLAFALAVAAPVTVASALVVLNSRDGLSLDRLLLAALCFCGTRLSGHANSSLSGRTRVASTKRAKTWNTTAWVASDTMPDATSIGCAAGHPGQVRSSAAIQLGRWWTEKS